MTVNVMNYLRDNFRGLMVYVRSSAPGHPSCEKALGPYSDKLYGHEESMFNWAELHTYDALWKVAIGALLDKRFAFMDITQMSTARPDGHSRPPDDCLHYCLPGLIDYWNFFLLGLLASEPDTTS